MGQCLTNAIAFGPRPPPDDETGAAIRGHRGFVWLLSGKNNIPAVFIQTAGAELTILYSHGNAEDLGEGLDGMEAMARRFKVNVFAYEYSGYSISRSQAGALPDASAAQAYVDIGSALQYLEEDLRVARGSVVLFGRSLGSGPTVHLASIQHGLAG